MGSGVGAAQQALVALMSTYPPLMVTRLLAGVSGVGALLMACRSLTRGPGKSSSALLLLSIIGLVLAEVFARALFYATGFGLSVG